MSTSAELDPETLIALVGSEHLSGTMSWTACGSSPYRLGGCIAAGGMGTVHLGVKLGALGFRRAVAIKRLHSHLSMDPDFVARFKDEIRLVARLTHTNVVQAFDVIEFDRELALVMEYVEGITLQHLLKDAREAEVQVPVGVVVGILSQALHGLHAAHEITDDEGQPLLLVHRDVSPQNIIIAREGLAKVLDFGVAKAASGSHITRTGQLSGKAAYMAPEQVCGQNVDRRTDVFGAGVVLWEALVGRRLFRGNDTAEVAVLRNVLEQPVLPPSQLCPGVTPQLDRVVLRALEREPARRFGSCRDFALALEEALPEASASLIASGIARISGVRLSELATMSASVRRGNYEPAHPTERPTAPPQRPATALAVAQPNPAEERNPRALMVPVSEFSSPSAASQGADAAHSSTPPEGPVHSRQRRLAFARLGIAALSLAGILYWFATRSSGEPTTSPEVQLSSAQERAGQETAALGAYGSEPKSFVVAKPAAVSALPVAEEPLVVPLARAVQPETSVSSTRPKRRKRLARSGKPSAPLAATSPVAASPTEKTEVKSRKRIVNCSPPTYTDSDGIRHFKPECL